MTPKRARAIGLCAGVLITGSVIAFWRTWTVSASAAVQPPWPIEPAATPVSVVADDAPWFPPKPTTADDPDAVIWLGMPKAQALRQLAAGGAWDVSRGVCFHLLVGSGFSGWMIVELLDNTPVMIWFGTDAEEGTAGHPPDSEDAPGGVVKAIDVGEPGTGYPGKRVWWFRLEKAEPYSLRVCPETWPHPARTPDDVPWYER